MNSPLFYLGISGPETVYGLEVEHVNDGVVDGPDVAREVGVPGQLKCGRVVDVNDGCMAGQVVSSLWSRHRQ